MDIFQGITNPEDKRPVGKEELKKAIEGNLQWLDLAIRQAGYIRPDMGVQQSAFHGTLAPKTLLEWEKDGLEAVRDGRRKYYPIMPFIRFVLDRSIKSRGAPDSEDAAAWKNKEAEFKAKERELIYNVKAGKFVEVEEVSKTWAEHINIVRKRLLAIPRALATRLRGESKPAVIEEIVKGEIYSALSELAGDDE